VFRVLKRHDDRYEVNMAEEGAGLLGRLKLKSAYRNRTTRVNLENHYRHLEVQEILREAYSGRAFPGYEDIDLTFEELEALVRNDRPDWKAALESVRNLPDYRHQHRQAIRGLRLRRSRHLVPVVRLHCERSRR